MIAATEDALTELLVQRLHARVTSAMIVDWATDALRNGEDTPSLAILAGLDRTSSVYETMPWLDKALSELNVVPPPPAELRRAFVAVVSRALMAGRITSEQALDRIHEDVVTPLGHPADLMAWCYVWEGLGPTDFRELTPADVDVEARKLAAAWARHAGLFTA